jgi:hypothetical protein
MNQYLSTGTNSTYVSFSQDSHFKTGAREDIGRYSFYLEDTESLRPVAAIDAIIFLNSGLCIILFFISQEKTAI